MAWWRSTKQAGIRKNSPVKKKTHWKPKWSRNRHCPSRRIPEIHHLHGGFGPRLWTWEHRPGTPRNVKKHCRILKTEGIYLLFWLILDDWLPEWWGWGVLEEAGVPWMRIGCSGCSLLCIFHNFLKRSFETIADLKDAKRGKSPLWRFRVSTKKSHLRKETWLVTDSCFSASSMSHCWVFHVLFLLIDLEFKEDGRRKAETRRKQSTSDWSPSTMPLSSHWKPLSKCKMKKSKRRKNCEKKPTPSEKERLAWSSKNSRKKARSWASQMNSIKANRKRRNTSLFPILITFNLNFRRSKSRRNKPHDNFWVKQWLHRSQVLLVGLGIFSKEEEAQFNSSFD